MKKLKSRLGGWEIVLPKRTTFYGMTEIGVREPAGNFILFAQSTRGEEASA